MSGPALPERAALFLDVDGTLLDLAPTPDTVVVPSTLPDILRRLRRQLDDALAVVTGRPVAQVDLLLPEVPYAIAGEHGGAIRPAPTAPIAEAGLPTMPPSWIEQAERVAAGREGVILEGKSAGFVLHYRLAPEAGPGLREAALSIMSTLPERAAEFVVMPAHMAWEIKPAGVDKGRAVAFLMRQPPFAGRVPVYVGDDVTDEDGIVEARRHGGLGLRVQDVFGDAAGVRAWLAGLSGSVRSSDPT